MEIVSLFSGAGGLDLGLLEAGHRIVWANDLDADAVATYERNIGNHVVRDDVSNIDLRSIPQADVVVGGFPCQGFSMANLKRHAKDERNVLYRQFLRCIAGLKPAYFLAENVRGILSLENGKAIAQIVRDFSNAGYRVEYKLFNTADYGVPQTRWRVIIAGTRKDLPATSNFVFPQPTHSRYAEDGLAPWVSIAQALEGIPEPGDEELPLANHICSQYKVTNRNFTGHRTTDPTKPSPTILARGNGKGGVCALQHPGNHRRLSIRESAIIQTFPLDFEFMGRLNSCYRQVGNAVPVRFARHLGEALKQQEKSLQACA